MNKNVWDKNVPIEKSNYISEEIKFFNIDNFKYDPSVPSMIDLFCGAGGFSIGCSWAGFQVLFGIDFLKPALETWKLNHPNSISCLGDIRKLDTKRLFEILQSKGVNHVDLITGGVPCQGFSISNRKHNDNDERNFLFKEYLKFIKFFNPNYIILENVSGLRSTANGKFENSIKKGMENLGYNVSINILNAADFGVPQIRKRLFFVGVKNSLQPYNFPIGSYQNKYNTVFDAIYDLPKIDCNESSEKYKKINLTEYQKLMRGIGYIKTIPKPGKLYNHKAPNQDKNSIERIKNTIPGQPMYSKFKQRIRLSYDKPSPTQLAGGIRPSFQFGHPEMNRGLTTRERARIQSFPDYYIFTGGIVQERVQTGNACPPLLVYNIVKEIYNDIMKEKNEF